MTDHTPVEMRGRADALLVAINRAPDFDEPELAAFRANALATIHAARRLAAVIEYVEARDDVVNYTVNDRLLRIARGETNERETS